MTLSSNMTLEQLVALRDSILKTITNLELGLRAEKKKADEFEFFRNDKNFDQAAMDSQAARSLQNVKSIKVVLDSEKNKLKDINNQILDAGKILAVHGTASCLLGVIPHAWVVLSRHPSGQFQHRKCSVCNSDEKVGCT